MIREFAFFCIACCMVSPAALADEAKVAAASDLKFALPAVIKAFEAETGATVKVTFGSSGMFATQIANGAPFEVFMSADEALVDKLNQAGLLRDAGQLYALGQLAIFAPEGSPVTCDADLSGLKAALTSGKLTKISLANPEHAPYGRAAKTALERGGLWEDAQSRLLIGESATQALQFATEGGAPVALVPAPLVEAPEFPGKGCHVRVSEKLAEPLRQRMGLLKSASKPSIEFAAFIISSKGRDILAKYGFSFAKGS